MFSDNQDVPNEVWSTDGRLNGATKLFKDSTSMQSLKTRLIVVNFLWCKTLDLVQKPSATVFATKSFNLFSQDHNVIASRSAALT